MGELTESICSRAQPEAKIYRLADMGGLYLEVLPSGRKTFRMQYRLEGRQLTYTIGEFPAVGLQAARSSAVDVRMMVKAGRDPKGPAPAADGSDKFRVVAGEWYAANAAAWKRSHASRVWSRVERFLLPDLGDRGVRKITSKDLLTVLQRIESPDTAKRTREYAQAIFTFAVASSKAEVNPAIGLSKALPRVPRNNHRPALTEGQLPDFFARLGRSQMEPATALCLRLLAHVAVRPGELIGAQWSEIQGERWIVPGERTKMGRDLVVPLSLQVLGILKDLRSLNPKGKQLADLTADTMGKALNKLMGQGVVVPHGFRSTFSTIANDSGLWNPDAIERQLGHAPKNAIRAAYNRALHLPERTRLMQWYSDQLDAAAKSRTDLSDLLA